MKREMTLFDRPGRENTAQCVHIVAALVDEGYHHVVVASTSGETAHQFAEAMPATAKMAVVTHSAGFKEPNKQEFDEVMRTALQAKGIPVLTATILTHSLETAFAKEFGGSLPTLVVANTLRRFGQGAKVACEIVMEAVDAGLLPEGEPVVAVAGSGHGADTVCVIRSATSKRFLDLQVMWIAAKPLSW